MKEEVLLTAAETATILNGEIIGNHDMIIYFLSRIENAGPGSLSFFSDDKYKKYLSNLKSSCLLVSKSFNEFVSPDLVLIKVEDPYFAFVNILQFINSKKPKIEGFIHNSAIIDETASVDNSAYIGPNSVVGRYCIIEKGVVLHSNVTLYDNVKVGKDSYLHSGVKCCDDTVIGEQCILQPGAVIGSDGFGYIEHNDGSYEKIPQLGNVILKDFVEIGSNTTIDRAIVGSTVIERGVKIDNLCQVAHNVTIGENTGIAGQAGIAGSCTIGKRNRLGGQSGFAGHLETCDDVIIYAQSGVAKSVLKKGSYFGSPIKERLQAFKIEAALNMLPDMIKDIAKIKGK